jgi:ATP-dependent RNA helicase SUPV3L1/SUV3
MQRANQPVAPGSRIAAVLGPTNTGKTHMAMERMLGHASGMIGFPLRLLARENYDRAVRAKGKDLVALITGEERIEPPGARYFLCTVEAMPLARRVAFLAVDEIQMAADPDRGHVFTERLLAARGENETMFMGAETIRPLLRRLVPESELIARPRFSTLSYAGTAKLSRLPPRTAIVAFGVADVYAIAELIRRERGGAAIVVGALSPRTRNAQVALYQSGDVDYLVATDAIGMGLNMAIDHVAFAATRKYDGRTVRALQPAELAQIAGRAGRYARDGTFGATGEIGPLPAEVVAGIEGHQFAPLAALNWRNDALAFHSLSMLKASLARPPDRPGLVRARAADDELALQTLERDPEISTRAHGYEAVRLLWDVCCIPDFGKLMSDGHARLLAHLYRFLAGVDAGLGGGRRGRLPTDWVARQVARLDRTEGDIEALTQRIAGIRIWTYVSHRADWLDDAAGWQQRTRRIEDRLSDALHERLTQRFVDRRTASVYGRLKDGPTLEPAVDDDGTVSLAGHAIGRLEGFRFEPLDELRRHGAGRAVTAAALRALRPAVAARLDALVAADDQAFAVGADLCVRWQGAAVGRLAAGASILAPRVEPMASELLLPAERERLRARLAAWLRARVKAEFAPLFAGDGDGVSPGVRGLVFRLGERLGTLGRSAAEDQLAGLTSAERARLRGLGLRIGRHYLHFPSLLGRHALFWRALLAATHTGDPRLTPFPPGPVDAGAAASLTPAVLETLGFGRLGPCVLRIDRIEHLAGRVDRLCRDGRPLAPDALRALAAVGGCAAPQLPPVLSALGIRLVETPEGVVFKRAGRRGRRQRAAGGRRQQTATGDGSAAFSALRDWTAAG